MTTKWLRPVWSVNTGAHILRVAGATPGGSPIFLLTLARWKAFYRLLGRIKARQSSTEVVHTSNAPLHKEPYPAERKDRHGACAASIGRLVSPDKSLGANDG